jgi:histidine triad (HIT) family protein
MSNIFKDIIDRKLPAEILFENERIIAIKDKFPIAPVHILIMPKKEISGIQKMKKEDFSLLGEILDVAQKLAKEYGVEDGYRLLTNNGSSSGQSIFHLHFHLIGGRRLGPMG